MKRRIDWDKNCNTCTAELCDQSQATFRWVSTKKFSSKPGKNSRVVEEIESWKLLWDGTSIEEFVSEESLKIFIIRFVYSLERQFAIPSFLLYEAGMRYQHTIWIDDWFSANSGLASEINIVSFADKDGHRPWIPKGSRFKFDKSKLRAGPTKTKGKKNSNFLRLEKGKGKKAKKGLLVPVKAPKVPSRYWDEEPTIGLPTYDRVLRERIPKPGFVKVSANWQDLSWESRVYKHLCQPPKVMPPDGECVTILTAEIGFPAPKKTKKA